MTININSLLANQIKVISVDFFDTLFWRVYVNPIDVFLRVGEKLQSEGIIEPDISITGFAMVRKAAEEMARKKKLVNEGHYEINLREIYDAIPGHSIDSNRLDRAISLELEAETEALIPDTGLFHSLTEMKQAGLKLAICSDTYFSPEHINNFITNSGQDKDLFDLIVLSNQYAIPKSQGLLFKIAANLAVQPAEIMHVGDHPVNDKWASQEAGIFFRPHAMLNEYGTKHFKRIGQTYGLLSSTKPYLDKDHGILGMGRRFVQDFIDREDELEASMTSYIFGPLLAGYFFWLVNQANTLNKKVVIFPTREGIFLSGLFNEFCQIHKLTLTAVPFLTSRKAIDLATLHEITEQTLSNYIFKRRLPISLRTFCRFFNLDIDSTEVSQTYLDMPLRGDCEYSKAIILHLANQDHLKQEILSYCNNVGRGFISYFESQVLNHDSLPSHDINDFMIADIGWSGSSLTLMNSLLKDRYNQTLPGRFLLLDDSAVKNLLAGTDLKGWLTTYGETGDFGNILNPVKEILEQVLMPEYPSVLAYDAEGDAIFAEAIHLPFKQHLQKNRIQALLREYLSFHHYMTDSLSPSDREKILPTNAGVFLRTTLAALYSLPTNDELDMIAAWTHEDNHSLHMQEPIINQRNGEIFKHATLDEIFRTPSYWHLGTVKRYAPHLQDTVLLRQYTGRYGADEPGVNGYEFLITDDSKSTGKSTSRRQCFINQSGHGVLNVQFFISQDAGMIWLENPSPTTFVINGVSMEIYAADGIVYEYDSRDIPLIVPHKTPDKTMPVLNINETVGIDYSQFIKKEGAMEIGLNFYLRRL